MVSRGVSVSLSSSPPAAAALARAFFFFEPPPVELFFSVVAEVGVGWFDPPSLSLLANVVESGVGAPGVEVDDVASEPSGCYREILLVGTKRRWLGQVRIGGQVA